LGKVIQEVFPRCPQMKKGYMYLNEAPGIGVDIDEKLAASSRSSPSQRGQVSGSRSGRRTALRSGRNLGAILDMIIRMKAAIPY